MARHRRMAESQNPHAIRYWPAWSLVLVLRGLTLLPLPVLALLGWVVGMLAYYIARPARRVAEINLKLCFPEWDLRTRRRVMRRQFQLLGESLAAAAIAWWGSTARIRRLVRVRDRMHYDMALNAGRNIILLAPHFLALDIGGIRLSPEREMMTMYQAAKNPVIDRVLRRRGRYGAHLIEHSASLKSLVRRLRHGVPFYYLPDQDPGESDTVFAPFFNVPAATVTALSRLAKMSDAVVIPCVTRIRSWGRGYELQFYAPLTDFPSADRLRDAITMNAAIERAVRVEPPQYLWIYKRFKRRADRNQPRVYD